MGETAGGDVASESAGPPTEFVIPGFFGDPAQEVKPCTYGFAVTCSAGGVPVFVHDLYRHVHGDLDCGVGSRFVGIVPTPDDGGYWLAQRGGGVWSFGDVVFHGSLPGIGVTPSSPVVGTAATADSKGYWLVGADGGVFAFGAATFSGSGA